MKQEKMIRYMNLIDSKYIAEADPANAKNITKRKSRTSLILRYGALAASFILVVGVLLAMPYLQHDDPVFPDQTDNPHDSTGPIEDTSNHGSESTDNPDPPKAFDAEECQQKFDGFERAMGGGSTFLLIEYAEETYNIAYLRALTRDETGVVSQEELDQWVNDVYLKQNDEEQNELPTLYQAIRDLGVTKKDFVALNDSRKTGEGYMVLSDEVVNALFLPEDEMKKVLVHPCALYYEGEIYTWTKLSQMSVEDLLNHGIPGEVLQNYIDNLIEYCVTNGFIPESHVSRYFGTEE